MPPVVENPPPTPISDVLVPHRHWGLILISTTTFFLVIIIGGWWFVGSSFSLQNFFVFPRSLHTYKTVQFEWQNLANASTSNYVAEDSKVYYKFGSRNLSLASSTAENFQVLAYQGATSTEYTGFAKDNSHVYIAGFLIEDVDPATFTVLPYTYSLGNYLYSKDINKIYYAGEKVIGADLGTFEPLHNAEHNTGYASLVFARDKNYVYQGGEVLQDADPSTVVVVGDYIKDKNHVIGAADSQNIDTPTFTFVGDSFYKDKNNFYCGISQVLHVYDPQTFTTLSHGFAKDKKNVYTSSTCSSLAHSDPATFTFVNGFEDSFAKDKNNVYANGNLLVGFDPSTFVPINNLYIKDATHVYSLILSDFISKADAGSFAEIPQSQWYGSAQTSVLNPWAKDKNAIYYYGSPLSNADTQNFLVLGPNYGKDKIHVYYDGSLITGADAPSFVASSTNAYAATDKKYHYTYGVKVDVDPALVDYIAQKRREGYSDSQIRTALTTGGYNTEIIDLAFSIATPYVTNTSGWSEPPTCKLTPSAKTITYGDSMTLTWTTTAATAAYWTMDNRYGAEIDPPPASPNFTGGSIVFTPHYTAYTTVPTTPVTFGISFNAEGPGGTSVCAEYILINPKK